jgi:putative ABC transport system substrate-binding protein
MRRHHVILGAGVMLAGPRGARAQQPAMPVIGFLHSGAPTENARLLADYSKGLSEAGFVDGQNVAIEFPLGGGAQ